MPEVSAIGFRLYGRERVAIRLVNACTHAMRTEAASPAEHGTLGRRGDDHAGRRIDRPAIADAIARTWFCLHFDDVRARIPGKRRRQTA